MIFQRQFGKALADARSSAMRRANRFLNVVHLEVFDPRQAAELPADEHEVIDDLTLHRAARFEIVDDFLVQLVERILIFAR